MTEFIDAFIISWPGKHENAAHIAAQLEGAVDRLTIFYANKNDEADGRPEPWRQFPDSWYFGAQFRAMIDRFDGDILLHIMADAGCDDWSRLVASVRDTLRRLPKTGVWSPNVDYTSHPFEQITVGAIPNSTLHTVTRTDETVWALSRDVIEHMRRFDYGLTPLGWGIDVAAAFYCHVKAKPVVLDTGVPVFHPKSTGYSPSDAGEQMQRFLRQLSFRERLYGLYLRRPFRLNARLRRLVFWATRSGRYKRMLAGVAPVDRREAASGAPRRLPA